MLQSISQVSFKANPIAKEETKETVANQNIAEVSSLERTPEVDKVDINDKKTNNTDKTGTSVAKKVGVCAASFLIPGLGQLINGEGKKALIMCLANFAINSLAFTVMPFLGIVGAGLNIYSAYDALKNA